MYQYFTIKIRGLAPLLMHNGRLADNRDPFTQELKRYTGRSKKSEENYEIVSHVEWCGGLYHSGTAKIQNGKVDFSPGSKVVMPADNLWACIVEGSKVNRLGAVMQAALLIDDDGTFEHDGPKDLNALAQDPRFICRKAAGVKNARVMRTRPMFRTWACQFKATIDTEQIDPEQLQEAIVNAGMRKGLCDWTPRYGRFELVSMKAK